MPACNVQDNLTTPIYMIYNDIIYWGSYQWQNLCILKIALLRVFGGGGGVRWEVEGAHNATMTVLIYHLLRNRKMSSLFEFESQTDLYNNILNQ